MRVKKGEAWITGVITLVSLYLITLFAAPDALAGGIGSTIVLALAFATVGYQAANVVDNAAKGRWYRPELDERRGNCVE